jgi:tRNA threonylcarbamoyladenosine biosynthesis protein TsaE
MEWVFRLENINAVAKEFWSTVADRTVIAFHGAMGSGKTTFIQALCEAKSVEDVVSSPTFSIINEYAYDCDGTKRIIFHLDLYRLKDEEEAIRAGVEDVLTSGYTCLVEWPDKAPGLLPEHTLHTDLGWVDEQTRRLSIRGV